MWCENMLLLCCVSFFFAKLLSIYCYIVDGGKWKNSVFPMI